jgi:uncharacterized protein (DUF2249 family)
MTTPIESSLDANKVLDVRSVPCSGKHDLILKVWRDVPVGDHFILLNHRDPVPLRKQFEQAFPGTFTWDYLERSTGACRIQITKLRELPPPATGSHWHGCEGH